MLRARWSGVGSAKRSGTCSESANQAKPLTRDSPPTRLLCGCGIPPVLYVCATVDINGDTGNFYTYIYLIYKDKPSILGGWGEIRTHGTLAGTPVFKTGALNRSATHPCRNRLPAGAIMIPRGSPEPMLNAA